MSIEVSAQTEAELDALFESAGKSEDAAPPLAASSQAPAAEAVAATEATEATEATQAPAESKPADDDELAGLPPKVRAMLDEFQTLKAATAALPQIANRLTKAEGRLGYLNGRMKTATPPPAPPKMEKMDRIREELPEVADAIEEFYAAKSQPAEQQPKQPEADPYAADDSAATSVLDTERPTWKADVNGTDFKTWLAAQDTGYQQKVKTTESEAVLLASLERFDAFKRINAQKLTQTRNVRAASAVVPAGAGRRAPQPSETLDEIFERAGRR
jgi:hypothetical protein